MVLRQYELYYVADSAHLESKRTKSKRGSELSLSRTNRPSLCADSLPLSAIQSKAIISSSSVAESRGAKKNADVVPTFLVRKVFDACPLSGGEFISGIDWDALHQTGMEEKVWDTEPIAGSDEEGVQKPAKKKVKTVVVERSMYLEVDTDSEEEERTRRMAATLDRREGKKAITLEKNEAAAMEKKAAKARQKSMAAKAMRESSDEEMEEAEVPVVDEVSFPSFSRFRFSLMASGTLGQLRRRSIRAGDRTVGVERRIRGGEQRRRIEIGWKARSIVESPISNTERSQALAIGGGAEEIELARGEATEESRVEENEVFVRPFL